MKTVLGYPEGGDINSLRNAGNKVPINTTSYSDQHCCHCHQITQYNSVYQPIWSDSTQTRHIALCAACQNTAHRSMCSMPEVSITLCDDDVAGAWRNSVLRHFAVGADIENASWCTWLSHRRIWCACSFQSATGLISVALRPRPYRGSGGQSTAWHRWGTGSIPGQSLWNLWWTKWHSDRFL